MQNAFSSISKVPIDYHSVSIPQFKVSDTYDNLLTITPTKIKIKKVDHILSLYCGTEYTLPFQKGEKGA